MAKIVIFSGAGISAESGIDTFRDSGGLWNEYDPKKVAYKGSLENNRIQTLEFYDKRRVELKDKEPNKAHKVLATLKKEYSDDISIITQNVDDLFEKAGLQKDKEVIHLHGFMTEVKCEKCGFLYDIEYQKSSKAFNGKCPDCHSTEIRPNIVMFGEKASNYRILREELEDCELLVVIGTSGNVVDVNIAKNIKNSILNNLESSDAIDESAFTKIIYKKATEAIDEIKNEIEDFLKSIPKQFHYKCSSCNSQYIFYKYLDSFKCTICKETISA